MFHVRSSLLLASLVCSLMWGCTEDGVPVNSPQDLPPDEENSDFVQPAESNNGKGDAAGIQEASFEGLCVLNFVNQATREELLDVAHSVPAKRIYAYRVGPDGEPGTSDDNGFETLTELDKVPWVGWITFGQLKRRALALEGSYCPQIGQETVLPGEDAAADEIALESANFVQETYKTDRPARRDAHAKAHGCVKAFVSIENEELKPEDRVGVFAKNTTYPAWIRFSNGGFLVKTDKTRDVRGLALKLMDVPGEKVLKRHRDELTQDFLFINGPAMFVRTPQDYIKFSKKAFDGNPVTFFVSLNPLKWKWRELTNLLEIVNQKPTNPLTNRYWSTTPYRLGTAKAVKYSIRPCGGDVEKGGWSKQDPEDLLRQNLAESLSQNEACFEFMVQHQLHPAITPIEDASVEWSEQDTPFVPVAKVTIPVQTFDTPAQEEFCENLSFNPWHTLPEHQPLGNVNRVRRTVYDVISLVRHELNGVKEKEPRSHEIQ